METKKDLLVDLDDVTADFQGAVKLLEPNKEFLPNTNSAWVTDVCKQNPRIFRTLKPIPGAIDSIKRLDKLYNISFLSSPMWEVPESYMDKPLWLDEHFGDWAKHRLILSHQKHKQIGDILIDDRIINGVDKFKGEHIHFGTLAFPTWSCVEDYLVRKYDYDNKCTCLSIPFTSKENCGFCGKKLGY